VGVVVAAAALPLVPAAAGPSGRVSVDLGAGHDDNMFLAAAPLASEPLLRLGGWFTAVAPGLTGALPIGDLRLDASYAGDLRQAEDVGWLSHHEGELALLLPPLGPVRLFLAAAAGRFDASRFPEDRFLFAGGEAGARLSLGESWRLRLRYRGEHRWLGPDRSSSDWVHALDAGAPARANLWLEVGPRASYVVVQPRAGSEAAAFSRLRGGLGSEISLGRLSASAGAWLGRLALGGARETHAGGHLALRLSLGSHLQLYAGADLTVPISAGATRDYARRLLTFGSVVSGAAARAAPAPPPERDQSPRVEPGRVRFRLWAPGAASVTVVGSWDDWQAPGRALRATREVGLHEIWIDLPGGSHRYHFMVDGQARRPPEAPRYAPDGFGGEDGVVDVPPQDGGSPSGAAVSSVRRRSYPRQEH
jgi:hypothetical protein